MFKAIVVFIFVVKGTMQPTESPKITHSNAVYPTIELCEADLSKHHMLSGAFLATKYPELSFKHKVACLNEEQFGELNEQIKYIELHLFRKV